MFFFDLEPTSVAPMVVGLVAAMVSLLGLLFMSIGWTNHRKGLLRAGIVMFSLGGLISLGVAIAFSA
jgi:hypothetical protein